MFQKLNINMKRVYPMLVVSTMSSGKSTLINALAGRELLPTKNLACTAKTVAILDHDQMSNFRAYAVDQEGCYHKIDDVSPREIENYNETNDLKEVIIEGEIQGIRNSKKALLLIDTPGINNSQNQSHGDVTRNALEECTEGLILYVINAEQMGTIDDDNLMNFVAERLRNHPDLSIIFAVNKMDSIDPAKESLEEYIDHCRAYIERPGITDPILVPVSARDALLFKKALNGDPLSEDEEDDLSRAYRKFRRDSFSLADYISAPDRTRGSERIEIGGEHYTRAEIRAALENTGIPSLEAEIDHALVQHVKMSAPRVTEKKEKQSTGKNGRRKTSHGKSGNHV